jgi:glucosylceramidase
MYCGNRNSRWAKHALRTLVVGVFLIVAILARSAGPAVAQEVKFVVSAKAGDRLTAKPSVAFGAFGKGDAITFHIDDEVRYQKIDGFGASFLEAGMICINSLPAKKQEEVFRSLFDFHEGAGFSAMKTVIAGTDFMSAGPWYTYNDTPGDVEMRNFSIQRDLGPNGLVTYIKRARKYGDFVLQAPMDYPPDWMLVNATKLAAQDVDPKYFDALALYYLRYLQEYKKQGIAIDYLCLFNEPGVYTKIPFERIRDLLKNHVGPLLAKKSPTTKIMLSEACGREPTLKFYPTVMDDPDARKYVAVMPYHGYDFAAFAPIAQLHKRYPDVPLWQTEVCHYLGNSKKEDIPRWGFEDGDFWANQIVSDLEAGASAWLYWNMVLDETGGPCLISPSHGDNAGNVQHAVVHVNRQTKEVTYTGCYYYLAHFSKFVRPGAVRVATTGTADKVRCVAFTNPEGGMVAQLLNSRPKPADCAVQWRDKTFRVTLPATSITTCLWKSGTP